MTCYTTRTWRCVGAAIAIAIPSPKDAWATVARTYIATTNSDSHTFLNDPSPDTTLCGVIRDSEGNFVDHGTITIRSRSGGQSISTPVTDSGRYRLTIPVSVGYLLEVRAFGYALREVVDTIRTTTLCGTLIELTRLPQRLSAVPVSARRPIALRDEGRFRTPGERREGEDDLTNELPDADALQRAAFLSGLATGLDPEGRAQGVSAFGLDAEQNSIQLNGVDTHGLTLPRDGLRTITRLATYDPRHGGYAGIQYSATLPAGTDRPMRSAHLTVSPRALQWTAPSAIQGPTQDVDLILSGAASGTSLGGLSYSTAYQYAQSSASVTSLFGEQPDLLAALGLSPESLHELHNTAVSAGLLPEAPVISLGTGNRAGTVLGRFDLKSAGANPSAGTALYVLAGAEMRERTGIGLGKLVAASREGQSQSNRYTLGIALSPVLKGVLSETKAALTWRDEIASAKTALPSVLVDLASASEGGAQVTNTALLGGNPSLARRASGVSFDVSSDATWLSWDRAHQVTAQVSSQLAADGNEFPQDRAATYTYGSVADLATGHPRALVVTAPRLGARIHARRWAIALSDVSYLSRRARKAIPEDGNGWTVQSGLRIDAFSSAGLFPSDTSQRSSATELPHYIALQPMVGFTWNDGIRAGMAGPARITETRHAFTGGVRRYVGSIASSSLLEVASRQGAASADELCFGDGIVTPNWTNASTALPHAPLCSESQAAKYLSSSVPNRVRFEPNFHPPESWRAEVNWRTALTETLSLSLGQTFSWNHHEWQQFDLNFVPSSSFALPNENGRPIWTSPAFIGSAQGLVSPIGSRGAVAIGRDIEWRSDLTSWTRTLSVGADWQHGITKFTPVADVAHSIALRVIYVRSDGQEQRTGFSSTTGADPRDDLWQRRAAPTHTVRGILNLKIRDWGTLLMSGEASSGMRYTPMVATDINADGLPNDRAFVFAQSNDTLSSGRAIRALLSSAPSGARECLIAQAGRVAAANSCVGEPTLFIGTVALGVDPYRLGLGYRGAVSLQFTNPLTGLDQLVHGRSQMRNWGGSRAPDPVLLRVRSFNTATTSFGYEVNSQFGSASVGRVAQAPFSINLDMRIDLGPHRERQAIKTVVTQARNSGRLPMEDAIMLQLASVATGRRGSLADVVISLADSLHLDSLQLAALGAQNMRRRLARDSIYRRLAVVIVSRLSDIGSRVLLEQWHGTIAEAIRLDIESLSSVLRIITFEQQSRLVQLGYEIDENAYRSRVERILRAPLTLPY